MTYDSRATVKVPQDSLEAKESGMTQVPSILRVPTVDPTKKVKSSATFPVSRKGKPAKIKTLAA